MLNDYLSMRPSPNYCKICWVGSVPPRPQSGGICSRNGATPQLATQKRPQCAIHCRDRLKQNHPTLRCLCLNWTPCNYSWCLDAFLLLRVIGQRKLLFTRIILRQATPDIAIQSINPQKSVILSPGLTKRRCKAVDL